MNRKTIFITIGVLALGAAIWGMVRLQRMAKVAEIISDEARSRGDCPETYPCLGLEDGWYRIDIENQPAYVEAKYAGWDAICSF